jgi:hypothetical protein
MVGSKEESTLRSSKSLASPPDFYIRWYSSLMACNSMHSNCIYIDYLA